LVDKSDFTNSLFNMENRDDPINIPNRAEESKGFQKVNLSKVPQGKGPVMPS